jgi:hypothetical protein
MGDKINLQGKLLPVTQLQLATGGTVAGTFYGIAFTLYCLYALSLAAQLRSPGLRRRAQFLFAYSTIIMLLALFNVAADAWIINSSYIGHCDFPGGPFVYGYTVLSSEPMFVVYNASQLAINMLTSAIQVPDFPNSLVSLFNLSQGLAGMGHLECYKVCQSCHDTAVVMFLVFLW